MSSVDFPQEASQAEAPDESKSDATGSSFYGSFDESPYRVASSPMRSRFWFAEGAWLDQEQTPAVVGFAWTHWLADRGVLVEGVDFDTEFALELYRAARREAGMPESGDETGGAFLWAGARVLQSRGFLEDCYRCGDVDSIVLALLERGPVVASLSWYRSMFEPVSTERGAVCHIEPGTSVVGGHAVVLNGVALDWEIDGTRGFVRLKSSWGRGWAEAGQALLSLDDLATVLADANDVFFPIPSRAVLPAGLTQDVAVPAEPDFVRYDQQSIGSDLWTTIDALGTVAYAEAIARAIQHAETRPPLTIGIKAPWGAGKTSLMRMIQERLEWPFGRPANAAQKLRPIELTISSKEQLASSIDGSPPPSQSETLGGVTNGGILRAAQSRPDEIAHPDLNGGDPHKLGADPRSESADEDVSRWRPTVWFNPWMYQTGEQVWAGLAYELIKQITGRMTRGEREHFWLQLNRRRIDEQAVRRKIYGLVLSRVLPWALGLAAAAIGGVVLLALGSIPAVGVLLTAGSPTALLIAAAVKRHAVLAKPVTGSLSQLVTPSAVSRFVHGQLSDSFEELVRFPDYESQAGFLYLVQTDVQRVLDLVATPDRPLVVFVDDLDRCSPATVVQVIEAINLFLAGSYPNSIFVIAMEPEMVAAHIEAAYEDLVKKIQERQGTSGLSVDLGWRFLEKIVQLPLVLPDIDQNRVSGFVESLFGQSSSEDSASGDAPREVDIAAAEAELSDASLEEAVDRAGYLGGAPGSMPDEEAVRRIVGRRLSANSPDVRDVIQYAARFLERNPREIKRFVNVFRFLVMIHTERKLTGIETSASLADLAKLAVVNTRWPSLTSALATRDPHDDSRTVFELLEVPPRPPAKRGETRINAQRRAVSDRLSAAGIDEGTQRWLISEELRDFFQSQPTVGSAVEGYL